MNRAYEEAFAEVDEILKIMPVDLLYKIPIRIRKIISENKAKNYKADIKETLDDQNLKEETVVVLGLIYRDFLASPEEREELLINDEEELRRIEQQYDMEKIFLNSSTDLIVYKQGGFLKKLFVFLKKVFKKNKF